MALAYRAKQKLLVNGILAFQAGDLVPDTTASLYGWIVKGLVEPVNVGDTPVYQGPYVPPGGDPGQVLTKNGSGDFDTEWADGGSGGGASLDLVAAALQDDTSAVNVAASTKFLRKDEVEEIPNVVYQDDLDAAVAGKLSASDVSKVGKSGVDSDLIARPVTRTETRGIPALTKRLDLVVGTLAQVGLGSIYTPWIIRVPDSVRAAFPQYGKWRIYTSTDHDSAAGGIAIGITMNDDPLVAADWTWLRRSGTSNPSMFDEGGNRQTETPCVVFDAASNRFLLYYQVQSGSFQGATVQTTRVVYSTNGVTGWSTPQDAIKNLTDTVTASNHTGYLRVYNLDGLFVGWHLQGAGSPTSGYGWSFSQDGLNWVTDQRQVGAAIDLTDGVLRLGISTLYEWRDELWALGTQTNYVSGANSSATMNVWTSPINLTDDLRSLRGRPQKLKWVQETGETTLAGPPPAFATMDDGRLVGAYRMNGETGSLALVVMA